MHVHICTENLHTLSQAFYGISEALVKDFCIRLQLLPKAEKKGLDPAWLMASAFRVFFSGRLRGKVGHLGSHSLSWNLLQDQPESFGFGARW